MRYLIILFSCLLFQSHNAQFTLSGQWVGVLVPPGNGFQTGVPILLEIDAVQKSAVGIFRLEKDQNWFQYEVGGSFTDKKAFTLQSKQSLVEMPKKMLESRGQSLRAREEHHETPFF